VHGACGRAVSRASFGFGCLLDCDDDDDKAQQGKAGDAIEQLNEEEATGALWECNFCCVECSGVETELAWAGSLTISGGDVGGDIGTAVRVAAEPLVWRTLLPFTADQWRGLPSGVAAQQVQRACVGRACRFCVCAGIAGEEGMIATQVKTL